MGHVKFEEKELKVLTELPGFGGVMMPVYDFPVSMRESAVATFKKKEPWWIVTNLEQNTFTPSVIPDNCARGFVFEGKPFPPEKFGGPDMFGVEWVYVPMVGGSMVRPGKPLLNDANEWREKVVFPDIDSWDWEGSAALNKEYLSNGKCNVLTFLNGCWFERLISFFDFENAALALVDEDQIDAIKELIHELTNLHFRLVDKCVQYYDLDGISIHDDWGSQRSPFFSKQTGRDIFLPEMKRFVDYVHSKGLFCDLHSCGHIEDQCGTFVEAGFDSWTPMPMNNTQKLYEDYGDKIILGIVYDKPFDPATASEEVQREAARDFVQKYTKDGKPCMFSAFYNRPGMLTPAFREELYKASRIRYSE